MTGKGLQISKGLVLPTDFATKSTAILAQRRKGKTYTASVIAEECVACEIPFVALDPTGAWWGLRASSDGQKPGLPVYVFGGEHPSDPELKLERTAGKLIADFVVDYPGYYVIDFKGFDSKEAERQFATDFAERLYRYKGQSGKDFVMHLFVDEADMFVPQQSPSGDKRMLGAFESIVRRGGIRGLGTSLISQRSAVVNKNVLEQLDILIALRTVGPNDREAIRKYVVANGTEDEVRELMGSIASLELGEAWIYEPGGEPPLLARVRIRERRTYNSSATPKAGEKRVEPKKLADVEIAALRDRMASTIEKVKASDPGELKKRIRELEREVKEAARSLEQRPADVKEVERVVEVAVVPEGLGDELEGLAKMADRLGNDLSVLRDEISAAYGRVRRYGLGHEGEADRGPEAGDGARRDHGRGSRPQGRIRGATLLDPSDQRGPTESSQDGGGRTLERVSSSQQAILDALAWLQRVGQDPARRTAVALVAAVSASSSGFANNLGAMRTAGLVDYPQGGYVRLTDAGAAAARVPNTVPDEQQLQETVFARIGTSKAAILRALVETYPVALEREDLAARANASPTSSGYANNLGALRTLGLVDYPQRGYVVATDALFIGGGA